jgi:hypothetical protein
MTKRNPKDYAKSLSGAQKRSKKSKTHTSILYNVTMQKQSLPAEPHKMRDNLPQDTKNIHTTDLWKILQSLIRAKFLHNEPNTLAAPEVDHRASVSKRAIAEVGPPPMIKQRN